MQEVRIWSEFSSSGQPCRQSGSVCISNLLMKAFSLLCPDLRRWRVVLISLFWWWNQSTMPRFVLEVTLGLPQSFRWLRVDIDHFFLYREMTSLGVRIFRMELKRGI
jgi:hypothetical protein